MWISQENAEHSELKIRKLERPLRIENLEKS